ncbi:MAG: c-type cytochrome biogenesis protein CcmI [Thiotrichaceae bacterium]|nr:c-type cytochrome biogenesis protein CcmI [Thiotrichaceae bacterium]
MLILFWITAAALTALALAFVMPALLKTTQPISQIGQRATNIAIYKERLAELEAENLSPELRELAKLELDQTLLHDVQEPETQITAARGRWAGIAIGMILPVLAIGGYLKSSDYLLATSEKPVPTDKAAQSKIPPNLEEMVQKLVKRLEEKPDDAKGWYMLGRSYTVLNRYPEAIAAYTKALALSGNENPQLFVDFAETLGMSANGDLAGKPSELLKTALSLNPELPKGLWLAGLAAAQSKDYAMAVEYWQRLLAQIPENETEDRQSLLEQINEAKRLMKPSALNAMANPSTATLPNLPKAAGAIHLQVEVSLAAEVLAKVNPTDTVFIYARAKQGTPMPLAVVKKQVKDLPLKITLDDSMAMTPSMKLSNFSEVMVMARVSSSGNALPQAGDYVGQVETAKLGETVVVNISRLLQ